MQAIVIAIGNRLRHDDGVGHNVLESLDEATNTEKRFVQQLTPEIAEEVAQYKVVIFVDAHLNSRYPMIRPVENAFAHPPFTHASTPAEIVAMARALFGFSGKAYTCRVPASDFSDGEGLSPKSSSFVKPAAHEIDNLVAASL